VKTLSDGSTIEFAQGNFDVWCVFVKRPNAGRYAPKDTDYFARLAELYRANSQIYQDYLAIYDATTKELSRAVLQDVTYRAQRYQAELRVEVDLLLTILYAAMVAEENRANTRLGKRIKRLAVNQILLEQMPVLNAANFSRGMNCRQQNAFAQARNTSSGWPVQTNSGFFPFDFFKMHRTPLIFSARGLSDLLHEIGIDSKFALVHFGMTHGVS
jgi:hypothetical protein